GGLGRGGRSQTAGGRLSGRQSPRQPPTRGCTRRVLIPPFRCRIAVLGSSDRTRHSLGAHKLDDGSPRIRPLHDETARQPRKLEVPPGAQNVRACPQHGTKARPYATFLSIRFFRSCKRGASGRYPPGAIDLGPVGPAVAGWWGRRSPMMGREAPSHASHSPSWLATRTGVLAERSLTKATNARRRSGSRP